MSKMRFRILFIAALIFVSSLGLSQENTSLMALTLSTTGTEDSPLVLYEGDQTTVVVTNPSSVLTVTAKVTGSILVVPDQNTFSGPNGFFTVRCPEFATGGTVTFGVPASDEASIEPATLVVVCSQRTLRVGTVGSPERNFLPTLDVQIEVGRFSEFEVFFSLPTRRPRTKIAVSTGNKPNFTLSFDREENIVFSVIPTNRVLKTSGEKKLGGSFRVHCSSAGEGSVEFRDDTSVPESVAYVRYSPATLNVQCVEKL